MCKIKKLLGQRIREVRKSKGITQEQLAEKIGIGTANISYIETGKYAPSIENFEKIVDALGVEPHELYTFTVTKSTEEMQKELFDALEANEELIRLVYKFYLAIK